ncbi:hypothetical protein ACFWPU_30305 [Streptomyces sp. NPDC058471]|uniref:hypothetical protein n=1 Tax=Streptomyces sp. NPDC058471 TaxID=3346516 RepID=UPI00365BF48A
MASHFSATATATVSDEVFVLSSTLLCDRPHRLLLGGGFDVVLVPEQHAREAVGHLDRLELRPVGAVFAIDGQWGFFLPEGSNEPPWPSPVQYLGAGTAVTVPPASWSHADASPRSGWVRRHRNGRIFTPPLLLHPIVEAISWRLAEVDS